MPGVSPQFQALHDGLSQQLGQAAQTLVPDEHGAIGFSLATGDTQLHAVQSDDGQSILLMAELGPLPAGAEREGIEALLEANHLLLDHGSPVFSRNPLNKHVTVQCARSIEQVQPADLLTMARQLVDVATQWRTGELLEALMRQAAQGRPVVPGVFA